jgi:hypothetical protein
MAQPHSHIQMHPQRLQNQFTIVCNNPYLSKSMHKEKPSMHIHFAFTDQVTKHLQMHSSLNYPNCLNAPVLMYCRHHFVNDVTDGIAVKLRSISVVPRCQQITADTCLSLLGLHFALT